MTSSCSFILQAEACNTDTTPTKPHRNSSTHRTKNNTANVVIQQNSRKILMMDILMSETCWAHKKWNKIASVIKLVFYSSTITMMHGPINIRFICSRLTQHTSNVSLCKSSSWIDTRYYADRYLLFEDINICNKKTENFILKPLNAKLNPICLLLALFGAHHILHVSR